MRLDEASDLFYKCVSIKASKRKFISNTTLFKHPNYKSVDSYFQVAVKSIRSFEYTRGQF